MDVHEDAGASYDSATAIVDEVAAFQRTSWPFDVRPKDLLILRRRYREVFRHPHVELVEPSSDPGELVQRSLLVPDHHMQGDTRNAMLSVRSSQALRPPSDPDRRRASYAVLTTAKRVQQPNPRQAAILEQRARHDGPCRRRPWRNRSARSWAAPNPPCMIICGDTHGRLAELEQALRRVRQPHGTRTHTSSQVLKFPRRPSSDREIAA